MSTLMHTVQLTHRRPFWVAHFAAMACRCEILMACENQDHARRIADAISAEVWRIEKKYSRYTTTGVTARINRANGAAIALDDESTALFQYAQQLYELSDGLFDISSGCLKNIWAFHHKKTIYAHELPSQAAINQCRPLIGLKKATLNANQLHLPVGMQIDFGGIGKEYAADKGLHAGVTLAPDTPILVNLGGDLVASQCPPERVWQVGISDSQTDPAHTNNGKLTFEAGGIATSGICERQWIINGKSYSHLLNPKTGWPVLNPPRTVTVAAATCMQAGMLSTLIMLQGSQAESFAQQEKIQSWIVR